MKLVRPYLLIPGSSKLLLKVGFGTLALCVSFRCGYAAAQMSGVGAGSSASYEPSSGQSGSAIPSTGLQPNSFTGSVPEGKATAEVLPLSFADAIQRGLRQNLGVLLASDNTLAVRGEKWKELSDLLPNLTTQTTESMQQESLSALVSEFQAFHGSSDRSTTWMPAPT